MNVMQSTLSFITITKLLLWLVIGSHSILAESLSEQPYLWQFDTAEQHQKFESLSNQIACPQCSGSPLAESNSPIALSLRTKLYELVLLDRSEQEILFYFHQNYGGKVMLAPQGNDKYLLISTIIFILTVLLGLLFRFYYLAQQSDEQIKES